jgi:hypothetical protein
METRDDLPAICTEREPDYVARHLEYLSQQSRAEYRAAELPPEPLLDEGN